MEILYMDKRLVAVNKPAGVPSQPDPTGAADAMTLASRALTERGEDGALWLVHRLDRVVGGVLIFARSKAAAAELCGEIAEKSAVKEYLAVVEGECEGGVLEDLLYKDARVGKSFVVDRKRVGVKEARLEYSPLASVKTERGARTLVAVRLHTGRFHQIRAQFSSRGMPIAGDGKYGSHDNRAHTPALLAARLTVASGGGQVRVSTSPDIGAYPWSLFENKIYEEFFK